MGRTVISANNFPPNSVNPNVRGIDCTSSYIRSENIVFLTRKIIRHVIKAAARKREYVKTLNIPKLIIGYITLLLPCF
jgi:hypothetical protein